MAAVSRHWTEELGGVRVGREWGRAYGRLEGDGGRTEIR